MAQISGLIRTGLVKNAEMPVYGPQYTKSGNVLHFTTNASLFNSEEVKDIINAPSSGPDRLFREIQIEIKAHQPDVLKSYSWFASTAAKELNIDILENWAEPEPHMMRKTLLKSVFGHSKHRVQYELRTYYHMLKVGKLTESTADTYLEYIQRNLPEGVAMKITKYERRVGYNKSSVSN
jgi:small subunit ribosomal protein S10